MDNIYREEGKRALLYFHNENTKYPEQYNITFTNLIEYIDNLHPTWLRHYGKAIHTTKFDQGLLKALNMKIARHYKGLVPASSVDLQIFMDAMTDRLLSFEHKFIAVMGAGIKAVPMAAVKAGLQTIEIASMGATITGVGFLAMAVIAMIVYAKFIKKKKR